MRNTNEHRRAQKRGKPFPERPPEKNRLYDETFGVAEKVEVYDENSIPLRVAERRGYLTTAQLSRILGIPKAHINTYLYRSRQQEDGSFSTPVAVGRLQVDTSNGKGQGAYLYDRTEILDWLRQHRQLRKHLPQELR